MEISERKKLILQAVIDAYIESAEPVGSKLLTEGHGLTLSSATIRNEMAELEELGLLEQPHTSAGRVPSQAGFRIYVNSLMNSYRLSLLEMQKLNEVMQTRVNELERFLSKTSLAMSKATNYTAVATTPSASRAQIKRVELLPIDLHSFIIVMVMTGGIVRNKMVRMTAPVPPEVLRKFSGLINDKIANKPLASVSLVDTVEIYRAMGEHGDLVSPVISYLTESISETEMADVLVEGADNILTFPEFHDVSKAKEMISLLQDKQEVRKLVEPALTEQGIKIKIGKENNQLSMSQSSIVLGNYRVGDKIMGAIGLIGPVRMDYSRVVSHIEYFAGALSKLLAETFEGFDE